jgi:hypothetical protein
MGRDRARDARDEARAAQWARIEEVAALPPELRDRLYAVLLEAVPHLDERRKFFGDVAVVLGAIIEYNANTGEAREEQK